MARIAGLIHWGSLAVEIVDSLTSQLLQHMAASEGQLLGSPQGVLGVVGPGGGIAKQGERILVLDGTLLDRERISDDAQHDDDAALLLGLCLRHGFHQAITRIDGDFSVVFLDATARRCWLARDRFGVKPLYYAETPWGFAFASQPAPLARLESVGTSPNKRYVALIAASHYRTFDNAIEASPFAAVRQLPAAHWLERNPQQPSTAQPYWRSQVQSLDVSDEDRLAEQYRELLLAAVQRRLAVATNPAFTLSGGMDSSSILCSAAKLTGLAQAAFSSIYRDPTYDERHEIQDVIDAGHAHWHPVEISEDLDLPSIIARLVAIHNEPVATATWLSHDTVCKAVIAAGYGSLFGGLGGDELNAGEYEYFPLFFADLAASGEAQGLKREIAAWVRYHDHPIHRKTPEIARKLLNELTLPDSPGRCLPNYDRQNRYAAALNPDWFDLSTFEPIMEHPFESFLANRAYQDLTRETTPCCLRAEDRQCTAHGLEHFDPFLDRELVEFMFSVPYNLKIREGVTKYLLRRATTDILPSRTRERIKKTGWNAPAHQWFTRGRSLEALMDLLNSASFRNRGIYNLAEVSRLVEEHKQIVTRQSNQENHMMFLWQLLNLEYWHQWLDGSAESQ